LTTSSKGKIALFDGDIIVYRVGFASEDVEERFALARVKELVYEVVYFSLECDTYELFITGKGNFRNDIAETAPYKGNRKDMKKPIHYDAIRAHLLEMGASLIEGMEADDAIAIRATELGDNCVIVSIDKDLDQIAGHHYNFVKNNFYTITEEEGLKNFYKQILTGDRVDNIIGIKGCGPVRADKLIGPCKTEQEMFDVCVKAYSDDGQDGVKRVTENGHLLWLLRHPNQPYQPPSNSQGLTGQSYTGQTSANTEDATPPPKPSTSEKE
jgi:5'-3' exonuclease